MIKAVIFDYFGVISSDSYWNLVKANKNVSSEFGELSNEVNTGSINWQQFVSNIANKTNKSILEVNKMYASEKIDPRFLALIDTLGKDYKIALLTNAHHDFLIPVLKKAHIYQLFDKVIVSSMVGLVKPDPELYRHTCRQLGITPSEAVFIDDIKSNTDAARAVGMQTIHYQNFDHFFSQLKTLLTKKA
jgi:putative hydrolase of the HAD superfamily